MGRSSGLMITIVGAVVYAAASRRRARARRRLQRAGARRPLPMVAIQPTAPETTQADRSGFGAWVGRSGGVAITIVGILVFAVVKLLYFIFYTRLGVDPDEIGLGYATILSRAALAAFFAAAVAGVVLAVWSIVFRELPSLRTAAWLTTAVVVLLVGAGIRISVTAANIVRKGGTIEPSLCNLLALRAELALVRWVGPSSSPWRDNYYVATYLGESGETTVLYDAQAERPVRVPSRYVVVSVVGHAAKIRNKPLSRALGCP
jgi:hypothetical protein